MTIARWPLASGAKNQGMFGKGLKSLRLVENKDKQYELTLSNNIYLCWSILKAFADDKISVNEN